MVGQIEILVRSIAWKHRHDLKIKVLDLQCNVCYSTRKQVLFSEKLTMTLNNAVFLVKLIRIPHYPSSIWLDVFINGGAITQNYDFT